MAETDTLPAPAPSPAAPSANALSGAPSPPDAGLPSAPWQSTLPEDLRTAKSLEKFKDVGAMAKSYIELEKKTGTAVAIPGPESKPEEVAAFRERLGVPKAPSDYEFPEGLDPHAVETFRGEFHKLGIPAAAAKALSERYVSYQQEQLDRAQQGWVAQLTELRTQWGEPLYNRRATAAVRGIEAIAEEAGMDRAEVKKFLDDTRLGDHPILFRLFATAGEKLIEEHLISGDTSAPSDAKARIESIRADKGHARWNPQHPGHAQAREEFDALYKLAYGVREEQPGR